MRRLPDCAAPYFLAACSVLVLAVSAATQPAPSTKEPEASKSYPSSQDPSTLESWTVGIGVAILLIMLVALFFAWRNPTRPHIRQLGPSFFFWLGMLYLGLLLVLAAAYVGNWYGIQEWVEDPLAEIMPIGVPWFGALGAVVISLQGVFDHNDQWDPKYNYWHIGRPLFGAVVGMVAFFLLVLIVSAAGTPPPILTPNASSGPKDRIIFYVLAFLVGYREETFRELLRRAVDLIMRPGDTAAPAPRVTLKVGGANVPVIDCGQSPANTDRRVTVAVHNAGNAPLVMPSVVVTSTAPAPASTFTLANDLVTGGGDLAPGAFRTVDVVFRPATPGLVSGTLTVTATNVGTPKSIPLSGTGT